MKKIITSLLFIFVITIKIMAQCPNDVKVQNIVTPTCGMSNGGFNVLFSNATGNVEVSLDSGVTFYPGSSGGVFVTETSTDGGLTFTPTGSGGSSFGSMSFAGLSPNIYHIVVRMAGTLVACQSFDFVLRANYDSAATVTPSASSNCTANGSIVLGSVLSTDSVSCLSDINPVFVTVGSLTANTIPNLAPGIYYVILKSSSGGNYCYSTQAVTVSNTGTACPVTVLCGNATDANNLFPNGTFGAGGNADSTNAGINGPPLSAGITQYTYQPLGVFAPEDGFYAIANNTYAGSDIGHTPFNGSWYEGYDHTGDVNAEGHRDGYMLVVNASYDPSIVLQETIANLCPHKKYQFSAYIRDLDVTSGQIPANLTFLINGIGLYTTGNIPTGSGSAWQQIGFTFQPTGTTATVSIRNNQTGGSGNDWALDDVYLGDCIPTIVLTPTIATCANPPLVVNATVTDGSEAYNTYQWEINKNDGNGFVDDGPVQTVSPDSFSVSGSYIATDSLPNPITPLNNGWQYRLVVGTTASDLTSPTCSYSSTQTLIIQGCDIIVPVKFISVKVQAGNDNSAIVSWQVANQLNVNHYELEKSVDGKNFSFVASVPVNAFISGDYSAIDNDVLNGTNYYRIKEVDQNGGYIYSNIVLLVGNAGNTAIKLFPDPASDYVFISIPANTPITSALIFDAAGRNVLQKDDFTISGNEIEVAKLPAGFYTVKIITADNKITNLSFVKKQ